jgi:hypothetical protein
VGAASELWERRPAAIPEISSRPEAAPTLNMQGSLLYKGIQTAETIKKK